MQYISTHTKGSEYQHAGADFSGSGSYREVSPENDAKRLSSGDRIAVYYHLDDTKYSRTIKFFP